MGNVVDENDLPKRLIAMLAEAVCYVVFYPLLTSIRLEGELRMLVEMILAKSASKSCLGCQLPTPIFRSLSGRKNLRLRGRSIVVLTR